MQVRQVHAHVVSSIAAQHRLGEAAEEGEVELSSKVLGSASLTTRERIRRDRELHRLGLNLVERVPKDVLVDLVQVSKLNATKSVTQCMHVRQIYTEIPILYKQCNK